MGVIFDRMPEKGTLKAIRFKPELAKKNALGETQDISCLDDVDWSEEVKLGVPYSLSVYKRFVIDYAATVGDSEPTFENFWPFVA